MPQQFRKQKFNNKVPILGYAPFMCSQITLFGAIFLVEPEFPWLVHNYIAYF